MYCSIINIKYRETYIRGKLIYLSGNRRRCLVSLNGGFTWISLPVNSASNMGLPCELWPCLFYSYDSAEPLLRIMEQINKTVIFVSTQMSQTRGRNWPQSTVLWFGRARKGLWRYWWPGHPVSLGEDSATPCCDKATPFGPWFVRPAISPLYLRRTPTVLLKLSSVTWPITVPSWLPSPTATSSFTRPPWSNLGFLILPNSSQ